MSPKSLPKVALAKPAVVKPTAQPTAQPAPKQAPSVLKPPAKKLEPLPSCGFAVGGSKKGELPLKTEKRARGKKVTIIPNVLGDATKLVKTLQALLGVGGIARQAEKGEWMVEVQGDQISRVTKCLLDFHCLQGISREAMEKLRKEQQAESTQKGVLIVDRTAQSKYLAQTQAPDGGRTKDDGERLRALEADFYEHFWDVKGSADDMSDVWEETLSGERSERTEEKTVPQTDAELMVSLKVLGMFAEPGWAVRDFHRQLEESGTSLKRGLMPKSRDVNEGPGRKQVDSNLHSRQKHSDWKSSTGAKGFRFTPAAKAITAYERGEALQPEEKVQNAPAPGMVVEEDEHGGLVAMFSFSLPFAVPASRLTEEEVLILRKRALCSVERPIGADLDRIHTILPGVQCSLDCSTFGIDLALSECRFMDHRGNASAEGCGESAKDKPSKKGPTDAEKEEMKLEKKLREICALRNRSLEPGAEPLEKLQAEKVARRCELFQTVAELKLRRAEKELMKVFKKHEQGFRDAFWERETETQFGDNLDRDRLAPAQNEPFGSFDESSRDGPITVSTDGVEAESRVQRWTGLRVHLAVAVGEVAAFAIEVVSGLVRLGWAASGGSVGDLGSDGKGFGYGGTGRKVHAGAFEEYGQALQAGDVVHCEAEREDGRVRVGFARNGEALGVAFDLSEEEVFGVSADKAFCAALCGKGFKVRIVSAECMPLDEAPGLPDFVEFDPPRPAIVVADFSDDSVEEDDLLRLWEGDTVQVASDDGAGSLFGYFLDIDDGGWFPRECVRFLDEALDEADSAADDDWAADAAACAEEIASGGDGAWIEQRPGGASWGAAPDPPSAVDWGEPSEGAESPSAPSSAATRFSPPQRAVERDPAVDEARSLPTSSASRDVVLLSKAAAVSSCVDGLVEWLASLSLERYKAAAFAWCEEEGAVTLDEVKENWEDFSQALSLRPLEKKRLAKAMASI